MTEHKKTAVSNNEIDVQSRKSSSVKNLERCRDEQHIPSNKDDMRKSRGASKLSFCGTVARLAYR